MNVSSGGSGRTLPRALILALLVGGTGAFLAEEARGADGEHAAEAADVLADGAVAGAGADVTGATATSSAGDIAAAGEESAAAPHTVETLVLPHAPGSPLPPQLPSRARHAKPRRHAREEVRPPTFAEPAASRGRHRAAAPLVLYGTGEIDWAALARCESGGNAHITDPTGRYGGLYQFDAGTWHSLGGHGLPQDASATEQTARARALFHQRGTSPWPACGIRAAR